MLPIAFYVPQRGASSFWPSRRITTSHRRKMPIKVGINGFGRIGRNIMRAALGDREIEIVAVNDMTNADDPGAPAEVRLDSGQSEADIKATDDSIAVDGKSFKVFAEGSGADAMEATSASTSCSSRRAYSPTGAGAAKHIAAGARR